MQAGEASSATGLDPLDNALDELTRALARAIRVVDEGALAARDHAGQVEFMQRLEQLRNRMALIDHRVVIDGEMSGLSAALTQPSMRRVLVHVLRLSPAEASRRVLAAESCSARVSTSGEWLPPQRPKLAQAQREGLVSPEQVAMIAHALATVDRPGFDEADIHAAEERLTRFATTFGAKDLKHLADQTVDAINPDGTLRDEEVSRERRQVTLRRCRDGMYSGEFRLTGALGAKLTALLQPLSRPRLTRITRLDGTSFEEPDARTFGQRTHDALEEVCDRVLRSGAVAGLGGTPATVIITAALSDLVAQLGYGTSSDGTLIPTREVLRLADEADIVPTVMNQAGAVLHLGRTRRIASRAQTEALIARDRGCSFPSCDRAPEWSERHHIKDWLAGGLTDLDNLTFLCQYHHHNFATRGWSCRMNADGLPEWIPPPWIDREQKPLMNSRIAGELQHQRQQRLRSRAHRPTRQPHQELDTDVARA